MMILVYKEFLKGAESNTNIFNDFYGLAKQRRAASYLRHLKCFVHFLIDMLQSVSSISIENKLP